MAKAEHVVRRPTRIGVMLLDPKAALVVQQAVEDMRCLARGRGNNLSMIRAELIGDMGVERHAWLAKHRPPTQQSHVIFRRAGQ